MKWLDYVIRSVSPKWGYQRETWRQSLEEVRSYDAGSRERLNEHWSALNESAEWTDRTSRDVVRARARDLERNSDMMNAVLGAYKRNVIGMGYTLQARTHNEEINKQIETYWKRWCKKEYCDVTGTQSFNQMIRMAIKRKKIDGGMLFHKVYTKSSFVPFQLQCLEVDELDTSQMIPKHKGNKVIGGIELNAYNKAVGYWIKQYDMDGSSCQLPIYIKASDMIYYFSKHRPSQVREMSDMSPTITRIRDTNEFMTAVSVKERIAACLAVFIRKQTPSGMVGRVNVEKGHDYNGKTIVPGMIRELNPGDGTEVINPNGQAEDASKYIKLQQGLIGAGQGLSYETTSRDMSQSNYSSARQGMIEDDLTYSEDKELLQEVMSEVYETFVISAYLSGLLVIPDFWEQKEKYLLHEWIQSPKKWIDPLKEANANKIALQTCQKTFQQIAAENGRDWQEQLDDIMAVMEYGTEKGVNLSGILFGTELQEFRDASAGKED